MSLIASDKLRVVVGLGKTGLACARYLASKGEPFAVVDSRQSPTGMDELIQEMPEVPLWCGPFDPEFLASANELVLSPGVAKDHPAIQYAVAHGAKLTGDIDLFCREVSAPIIAITGSNAKSTVTTLVGEMVTAAGMNVGVCGNIGVPVLEMLQQPEKDIYVIELSSFQLETTHDLRAKVATVLNITPDHLDRYPSMMEYHQAKHRIFRGCQHAVINRDDPLTAPLLPQGVSTTAYHLGKPDIGLYGVESVDGEEYLSVAHETIVPVSTLKIRGQHNVANALAALALGEAAGLPREAMINALQQFAGLEHRCQWVRELDGVNYYNDSKGTNVGATLAAINGLGQSLPVQNKIVLIAGGVGKGAEFHELDKPLQHYARALVYIGEDGDQIASACSATEHMAAESMLDAVNKAAKIALSGDIVLLSPACASFDMFSGFPERGERFVEAVTSL